MIIVYWAQKPVLIIKAPLVKEHPTSFSMFEELGSWLDWLWAAGGCGFGGVSRSAST